MTYRDFRYLAPILAAGLISCSNPPAAPSGSSGGSGGSSSGTGGSSPSSGGSSGSGGATSTGGASGSGGSAGSAGSGGSTASGGSGGAAPGTGGATGSGGTVTAPDGGTTDTPPAAVGCPAGVQGHCSSATYPEVPGFKLALVEDFDQPLNLDTDPVWTWGDGVLDEGAVRMTKNNITFNDGKMRLTVKKENAPGGRSEAENKTVLARQNTSGEMRTKFNNFRYGRYEVRLKPPASKGNFISTMFTFRTPKAIQWREVDIEVTASAATPITTNVVHGNGATAYDQTKNHADSKAAPGFDPQADFHDYAFEWLPGKVTWYIDGKEWRKLESPDVSAESTKIMMNLWVFNGAAFGGPNPSANPDPMYAEYEWFRFYKADAETMYPCTPTPGCLPTADKVKGSQNNSGDAIP